MDHLDDVLLDLQETTFTSNINSLIPPYNDDLADNLKFLSLYKNLRRAVKLKARLKSLKYAFFLGQFMDSLLTNAEKTLYRQQLTRHYESLASKVFDLFESQPNQILKTKFISVITIRSLKRDEIVYLRNELISFAGAQV
jgi:hypothetical protein